MADTAARYVGLDRYSYARALLALVRLSRTYEGPPFRFGPLSLQMLEQSGLEIVGSDLSVPRTTLEGMQGLVLLPG